MPRFAYHWIVPQLTFYTLAGKTHHNNAMDMHTHTIKKLEPSAMVQTL